MTDADHAHYARRVYIGVVVLIVATLILTSAVFVNSYQGRVRLVADQRTTCVATILSRVDVADALREDASFRHDAAVARAGGARKLGRLMENPIAARTADDRTAVAYEALSLSAAKHADRLLSRTAPARLNVLREQGVVAQKEAERACTQRIPSASLIEFG